MSGGGANPEITSTVGLKEVPPLLPLTHGIHFGANKQRWHSLPLKMLIPLADAYCIGGAKYPPFNCLLPFPNGDTELWDKMMRHLEQCQINPLAKDPEDNCYHLAKAAWACLTRLHNAQLQETSNVKER